MKKFSFKEIFSFFILLIIFFIISSRFYLTDSFAFIKNQNLTKLLANIKSSNESLINQENSNIFSEKDLSNIKKEILEKIPPHIDIFDFYATYGKRLLGDENIKIFSREEWGVEEAENIFQKRKIFNNIQNNSPEDKLELKDYWRLKEIILNYQKNFSDYDDFFLKSLKKENGVLYQYVPVEEIIIHHTGGPITFNFEDSKREIQKIYLTHKYYFGWSDIGYHFLIDAKGNIFEGSLGGKYSVGAHTFYHNKANIAIALIGDFREGHDKITPEMFQALVRLIKYLIKEYHFDLSERVFYLRKADFSSREYTDKFIKGHKELDFKEEPTQCPGIDPSVLREMLYPFIFP